MRRIPGIVAIVAVSLCSTTAGAQSTRGDIPRTPWGDPDLQGVWDYRTVTPLERPPGIESEIFTEEEATEFERAFQERLDAGSFVHPVRLLDFGLHVSDDRRTSLIVVPVDGRIPPLTPDARAQVQSGNGPVTWRRAQDTRADHPEDRGLAARCLLGLNSGPPFLPGPYNNNVLILQTPHYVVLHQEMIHESRIVPLDGRSHVQPTIAQWLGDSRGRWEGDTLVVETTNFTRNATFNGQPPFFPGAGGPTFSVVERLTRTAPGTMTYEFTVRDPTWWTADWTAVVPLRATEGPMYEYACHEGNQAVANILSLDYS